VGIDHLVKPGERVDSGSVLARVDGPNRAAVENACSRLLTAFEISEERPVLAPLIVGHMMALPGIGWRGVMIGSSVACWSANRRFHEDRRDKPAASISPALFVRTVANAVNGDISIALRLAGPCDTFVSGFTAGAEAVIAAAAAIDAGRARAILAGGVEAPEGFLEPPPEGIPVEAAGFALVRRGRAAGATTRDDDALRLVAWHRCHDPAGAFRLAAAFDALHPTPIDMVLIANRIPGEILGRCRADAGDRPLLALADRAGETGAAGAPIAAALARAAGGAGPAGRAPSPPRKPACLILGRDPGGDLAALVVQG